MTRKVESCRECGKPRPVGVRSWSTCDECRFWKTVNKNGPVPEHAPDLGPCWVWMGGRKADDFGYGQFMVRGKNLRAHRFAFALAGESLPEDRFLCHRCDRPECVRPDHLFVGTQLDNMRDAIAKDRHSSGPRHGSVTKPEAVPHGVQHWHARLDPEKVREIRQLSDAGVMQREIARRFGIARTTVSQIVLRHSWKDVP